MDERAAKSSSRRKQPAAKLANERLILALLRRHPSLSKIEVSRLTGLSVQTAAVLINKLALAGLITRLAPQRGRVGQPAVPFELAPGGAYALGLKIGRRSCDLVLIDFLGKPVWRARHTYAYPLPGAILVFLSENLPVAVKSLPKLRRARIAGLGVAIPFELWNWGEAVDAQKGAMEAWRGFDALAAIRALSPFPVTLCNDATAACAAEIFFGQGWRYGDLAYFFIGFFIGGGIALNGALFPGRSGNAGALGSMPVAGGAVAGASRQLIRRASLYQLESRLRAAGIDPGSIWRTPETWDDFGAHLDIWIDETARALAQACVAAISVIDFSTIMIDGLMPPSVRARLVARVTACLRELDLQGLSPVEIREGTIGADARAIGGAALPLIERFGG